MRASSRARRRGVRARQPRPASSRRCPPDSSTSASWSNWLASTDATRQSVTAVSVDVRTPAFQVGPLAEHRPGTVLGQLLAVPLHPDDPVQHQVDRGSRLALADQRVARPGPADHRLGRAVHELHGQRPFQGGLDRGDQRGGILVAPRAVLAERRAGPAGVVGQAGLVAQAAVGVVDPVPGERARPGHRGLGGAVGVQGQRQRGPHQRGQPLHVGGVLDRPGHRHPGAAADGLGESHPARPLLGRPLDVGQLDRLEAGVQAGQLEGGGADQPGPGVAGVTDLPVVADLDPGPQRVGEPEFVRRAEFLEVPEFCGRRVIVVAESRVEGQPAGAGDRLRRDPRD